MNKRMRILCAIANHGTKNQDYLDHLLASYRAMPAQVKIVVLSNLPKELGTDVEVRVGLPSSNPWSLPFAHRMLFRQRLEDYDYFIYSEDDTLLTWPVLQAFIESINVLRDNEIAGFVRTEKSPEGDLYYTDCHSFYRWIPSSVRERGGKIWARYSDEHAACFVASRDQLRKAIQSGGFPLQPHEGRHDMLCTAATDIYTQCGFERLVCIDEILKFRLPHLPNKYIGNMGLPSKEMDWQIDALRRLYSEELSSGELIEPETKLPGCVGSKFYHERPDPFIEEMLDGGRKRILVWGSGDGIPETSLKDLGNEVSVVPLNEVVGESCRYRGLNVLPSDFGRITENKFHFDAVVLRDILHLMDDPVTLLAHLRNMLKKGGIMIARVPNFYDIGSLKRRLIDPRFKVMWSREYIGATQFTVGSLRLVGKNAGFSEIDILSALPNARKYINNITLGIFTKTLSPYLYLYGKRG